MKDISVVAIDIAKEVFQVHAADERGKLVQKRKVYRSEMSQFLARLKPCIIAMEACGGSHYWARESERYGHEVRLLPGEFVSSYVYGNKNNEIDAAAIAEASRSPRAHYVSINSIEQQDLQMKHRIRSRLKRNATAVANEIHGFLLEYGVVIPRGMKSIRVNLLEALEKAGDKVSAAGRDLFLKLCDELQIIEARTQELTTELETLVEKHPVAKRLSSIPGIGPITATALIAAVGDPGRFKNGRQFAAWLGLTPRQNSTGNEASLGRITKRGDGYIRSLLVQGANACVTATRYHKGDKVAQRVRWMKDLLMRRGRQKTVVATANKTARIAWAIMASRDAVYKLNFVPRAA
jgi:transposase